MYRTYVINLKQDKERYKRIKKAMESRGIQIQRFDAIYGRDIKNFAPYDQHITNYCKRFCPKGLVGCGLSHRILLSQIYDSYQRNPDTKFSLILEDDAIPRFRHKTELDDLIRKIPHDSDITLLFCQGYCGYQDNNTKLFNKNPNLIGSTAAYVVRNRSIPKLLQKKLFFHIDVQWYNDQNIVIYISKQMFNVSKNDSHNMDMNQNNIFLNILDHFVSLDNTKPSEVLNYRIFRMLYWEPTILSIIRCICFFIILMIVYRLWRRFQ